MVLIVGNEGVRGPTSICYLKGYTYMYVYIHIYIYIYVALIPSLPTKNQPVRAHPGTFRNASVKRSSLANLGGARQSLDKP